MGASSRFGSVENGNRFYARLNVPDENSGVIKTRRSPLLDRENEPMETVAQAEVELRRLQSQRDENTLSWVGADIQRPCRHLHAEDFLRQRRKEIGPFHGAFYAEVLPVTRLSISKARTVAALRFSKPCFSKMRVR